MTTLLIIVAALFVAIFIFAIYTDHRCPVCGRKMEFHYKEEDDTNLYFCPNCGKRIHFNH